MPHHYHFDFLCSRITTTSRSIIQQLNFHRDSPFPWIRFLTTTTTITKPNQTIDFLVTQCGLPPESALKASQQISIKSTNKPNSVLSLFNAYGFTPAHISKLITKSPSLLLSNADNNLRPKLEFFRNLCISRPILVKIVVRDPRMLKNSLENTIIPSINFLKKFVRTDDNVAFILNRSTWFLSGSEKFLGPNIAILRQHGVPEFEISKIVLRIPRTLSLKPERFTDILLQLKEMGIGPSSTLFISSLHVLSKMKKPIWDSKLEAYKSFGFTVDEILSLFRRQPFIMTISVKKISSILKILMNSLTWTLVDVAQSPHVLYLSLEKRVIPRCYVIQNLLTKGLITKSCTTQALRTSEDVFLKKYVCKYQDELPEILKEYQSKMCT